MTPDEYNAFCESCTHVFMEKNRAWSERFGIGALPRWDYDSDDRLLVSSDAAAPRVLCTYLNVGSYSSKTGTWLWAWGNDSVDPACREGLEVVRDFGLEHGIGELSEPRFEAVPEDGWALAAIAGRMLKAQAIYRPEADHLRMFMLVLTTRRIEG